MGSNKGGDHASAVSLLINEVVLIRLNNLKIVWVGQHRSQNVRGVIEKHGYAIKFDELVGDGCLAAGLDGKDLASNLDLLH